MFRVLDLLAENLRTNTFGPRWPELQNTSFTRCKISIMQGETTHIELMFSSAVDHDFSTDCSQWFDI